jgi:hypothetical protein
MVMVFLQIASLSSAAIDPFYINSYYFVVKNVFLFLRTKFHTTQAVPIFFH